MLIDINKIIVNDRIRKDYGDLEELAEDIKENTLLNALVVSPNTDGTYTLIAGERRLRAMRDILGYTQVTVNTVGARDNEHALLMEISENECRKEFTKTERLEYARRLTAIEAAKAKERQGTRTDIGADLRESARTDETVADTLGTSASQMRREQFISDNRDLLDPADFADWDEGKLSTNKAYQRIKAAKEQAERERDEAIKQRDKARKERGEARKEANEAEWDAAELRRKLGEMEEPQVIERTVEVVPEDVQQHIKSLERETARLNDEYQKMWQKKMELDKKLEQANELLGEKQRTDNAQWDIEVLTTATNNYLRQYGGKAWAFDQLYRVDELTQREFEKAITNLASFAQNMVALIADRNQIGANNE